MRLIHKLIIVVNDEGTTNTTALTVGLLAAIVVLVSVFIVIVAVAGYFHKRKAPGLIRSRISDNDTDTLLKRCDFYLR